MIYQNENFDGSYDFRSKYHDGWEMEMHLHEYSELLYCKSGVSNCFVNGKHIRLGAKEMIWIPSNYVHQYNCENAEIICAVFSNDFVPLFKRALDGKSLVVSAVDASGLTDMIESLPNLNKEDQLVVSGTLSLICAAVLKVSELEESAGTDGVLCQKVISYISTHYAEDITQKSIAKKFGYNEKYLSHTLHEVTGIHFRRLLSLYRINRAKELLCEEKQRDISEIALISGFSALNTFHRSFKEMTSMTPSEYRNKYKR